MPESNQLTEQPTVSVVVASYNSWESLEQCLSSLAGQQTVEVIVADCSDSDHTPALAARFPSVKFRHFNHRMSIPQLRWAGVSQSTGEIVALTECWMVPSPGWVAALRETHVKHPADPAVGGPVDFPPRGQSAPLFLWADYFSDHIQYMPPADDGYRDELPGHNCSYRRWVFDEFSDLIERGAWDPLIHRRLKNRGYHLRFAGRAVVHYCGHLPRRKILSQRFHYGRWSAGSPPQPRMLYVGVSGVAGELFHAGKFYPKTAAGLQASSNAAWGSRNASYEQFFLPWFLFLCFGALGRRSL